ncbi:gamma-glutamyltransferase [Limobrevibacterium gyesilva]|uniref:Glutathione hydrolase proenzyme n=1 Tax=Limobrevibacterium gyesilva TaxID=2991712 RepID=A0AA41YNH1_9PROT|nr:gamma-glutamyltransferase [Limobrevibacterium gyesilva]MCW3475612.1 gamma-glutamyltransferase [Limobrevibacterium gyesilva]
MSVRAWRTRAATTFTTEKRPATGSRGMVVTNHPLASAAGSEMLAAGGNAIDAAVAAQFALTVVEPMMIGLIGGGTAHIRTADGTHTVLDGMSVVPGAGTPDMYRPIPGAPPEVFDVADQENTVGPKSVAAPGSLRAWCLALQRFGTMPLADVMQPAIRLAARGFTVTPYLNDCITSAVADLVKDPLIAARYMPGGSVLPAGTRLVQGDYAEALTLIAQQGEGALHGGPLGDLVAEHMARTGGYVSRADLATYRVVERAPLRAPYRGWEIVGPPPPAASGVHILQMLNILEGYDVGAMGFGTVDTLHLLAEVLKIAFADRAAATADPDFVAVPVARLISKDYAAERRARIDLAKAQAWGPGVSPGQGTHTTHLTVADGMGNVVASTQTINNLFGARYIVPGTGMIPNNYMSNFDPRPGRALSIAPGKRVTTSMSPVMALRDGNVVYALGLPGGKKIFPSAMQALVNLIDHGMSLQEAVEAPRIWTEGVQLEVEGSIPEAVQAGLAARGHTIQVMPTVAGGMNAIQFHEDGSMTGAACWRADGTPMGTGGGLARAGVRFVLETRR